MKRRMKAGAFLVAVLAMLMVVAAVAGVPSGARIPVVSTAKLGAGVAPVPPSPERALAPESLSVLLNQPSAGVGYVDQVFPDFPAYSSYLADDFTNPVPWTISSIQVPGSNSAIGIASATSLTWSIYADSAALPGGYPGVGAAPYWTLSLPPGDPQVSISGPNVTLNLTTPVSVPAGSWWFEFVPTMSNGVGGQWFWLAASSSNGAVAKFINPGGGFALGTAWQDFTVLSNPYHDCAFTLSGTVCSYPMTITMSALGGTTADWPVAHGSETSRPFRNGVASTCAVPKPACPGSPIAGTYAYDAFSFQNEGSAPTCVTATLTTACTGTNFLFMQAYLGAFNPASICTNYLADIGSSPNGAPGPMSFTVPAGATFLLVVTEVTAAAGCPTGYTVTVDGLACGGGLCTELVQNGGFETGDLTGWTVDGTSNTPVVNTAQPHTASYSALLGNVSGGEPNGNSSFYQTITVPAAPASLSFWYWPYSTDSITFDWQDAYIQDGAGVTLATIMHLCSNAQAWTNQTFDLTPYAGQTIRIKFLVHQDGFGDDTAMYLDDVSVLQCVAPCPTITLSPATLPLPIVSVPYTQTITATGGTGPYAYAVTAGALPTGFTLSAGGILSGTLTALGSFSFTVTATDSLGCTGDQAYALGTYSTYFLDDGGRSKLCVNRLTGAYTWEILMAPGVGVYTGVAYIVNGGTKIYSKPGDPNMLNCTYDPIRKRASGYFYTPAGAYSRLADLNTTNNAGGCP